VLALAACEKAPQPAASPPPPVPSDAAKLSDAELAMMDFLAYSDSVYKIMRDHGKDCDEAARLLEPRAAVFAELGPRMMKLKESMAAMTEAERERIKRATNDAMEAFKASHTDYDAIETMGKACEQSSPAFAAISKRVMFTKKK
jgi:hypothetical protein